MTDDKNNQGTLNKPDENTILAQKGYVTIDGAKHNIVFVQTQTQKEKKKIFEVYLKVGAFFDNTRKREGHNDPKYSGSIQPLPHFDEKYVAVWSNQNQQTGEPFASIRFNPVVKKEEDIDQSKKIPTNSFAESNTGNGYAKVDDDF